MKIEKTPYPQPARRPQWSVRGASLGSAVAAGWLRSSRGLGALASFAPATRHMVVFSDVLQLWTIGPEASPSRETVAR